MNNHCSSENNPDFSLRLSEHAAHIPWTLNVIFKVTLASIHIELRNLSTIAPRSVEALITFTLAPFA